MARPDDGEVTRYSRHLLLPEVGASGQQRLSAARVLVVGAGGLGSPVLHYLAAAGVGTLGIIDDDTVDLSNLQRQVIHGTADVGRPKVDSAIGAIGRINPGVQVIAHRERLTSATADALLRGYDVVVDGTDTFETRYVIGEACARAGLPHVWASVLRFDGQVSVWWAGRGPCYRCVFPHRPAPGEVPSCAEAGVLGALVGVLGSIQATETLKILLGVGDPLVGRLLVHDGLAQRWAELPVRADPGCPVCGDGSSARQEPQAALPVEVPVVTARDLACALAAGQPWRVVDVRPDGERAIVSVPGSAAVELAQIETDVAAVADRLGPRGQRIVLVCKSGARSARAGRALAAAGWRDVVSLEGGVLAWVRDVEPGLPTY